MLTDAQARKAKPSSKPYKLADANGLHLYVTPAGGRFWRYRYLLGGKEKLLSLGSYPDIGLADARAARDLAKKELRAGRDPSALKQSAKLTAAAMNGTTFEAVANHWHEKRKGIWTETHASDVLTSLQRDIYPAIGSMPIGEVTVPALLAALRKVEARDAIETAHRIRQRVEAVFNYAIASGVVAANPAAVVKGALSPLPKKGKQPAITDLDGAQEVLRRGESVPAHPVTKLALRILALTALRPGELRGARWEEFRGLDGPTPEWVVPAERMKMKVEHGVPLSRQAVDAIKTVHRITGRGPLVFPMIRHAHKPLSENAIGYLLNRAGYHSRHVPHGWRATFSTVMNERHPQDERVIDLMLAHAPKDTVQAAYNRALHAGRRRELAQIWADLLMVDQQSPEDILGGAFR